MKSREQKLIDIMFEIAMTCARSDMAGKSNEEIGQWVAEQLRSSGFDTSPCGASWGVLNAN